MRQMPVVAILCIWLLTCWGQASLAQPLVKERHDPRLQKKIETLCRNFQGVAGVYVKHLKSGKTASVYADTLFPTASLVKIPILMGIMHRIDKGEIKIDSNLLFRDSLRYSEYDILAKLRDSSRMPLGEVMMLSVTTSDNTAALWCQQLAGTGTAVNQLLDEQGFRQTRLNSRTPGREKYRNVYGWGQTTPREMATLLLKIRQGRLINSEISEEMYRYLSRSYWDGEALSQIPPFVKAMSKQGAINQSRSEVVLVNAPHGDYVFCVMTKNQKDISWKRDNEGYALIRAVSHLCWQHFERKSGWQPTRNFQKWYK